ncbi:restriction endonuclease [Bradyrhizobium jicamae]|uniref:Restriction endonuclease n=1 Tax=Bradyrhizobium jicamae TaxID=280332 RepID=A0A0R3MFG8_9BRAD|nr:5-methylcytosine-specific restriction endonuclease system specificity protein McrC [Bradyrhizobium jicamae]KRR16000.1 restriction endonuclease [Bradyrhizobium jicamae]
MWRSEYGIPVRNLWVLLAYASDLAVFLDRVDVGLDDAAELPDVLARLLIEAVERRLQRNLSRGYESRQAIISRVRGRIDWLETLTGMQLERGRIACRFEEQTFDTPRNRYVRAALVAMAAGVRNKKVGSDCRRLAKRLHLLGVGTIRPTRRELSRDQIASHQSDDRLMVSVARIALDLVLPNEASGSVASSRLSRDEALLRSIFEKAVAGFYKHEFHGRDGWKVHPQSWMDWDVISSSTGAHALLPRMKPDLKLDKGIERRIVMDTKFTNVLTPRMHGGDSFKSEHIYQLYAYLRSQADRKTDPLSRIAEGILLYPSVDRDLDEFVIVQGQKIRFATVDLMQPATALLNRLRSLLETPLEQATKREPED